MAYIGQQPTIGAYHVLDSITLSNGQSAYTMQLDGVNFSPQSVNHMLVIINGVPQPASAYSINGHTLTLSSAATTGDVLNEIRVFGDVLNIGTPSDATVTNAKTNFVSTSSAAGLQIKGDGTTDGTLQLNCRVNSHGIKLKSPPHSAAQSYTLTFPSTAPSADKALITDGSGNLSFGSAGGLVKLVKQTASNSSSIDFTSTHITSSYNYYRLICRNWKPASTSVPRIRFSEDNLSTFESDSYQSGMHYYGIDSTGDAHQGATTTGYHNLNNNLESTEGGHFIFDFPALNVTGKHKCLAKSVILHSSGYAYGHNFALRVNASRTYNSFQLYMSSGNITSGDFILYGVAE